MWFILVFVLFFGHLDILLREPILEVPTRMDGDNSRFLLLPPLLFLYPCQFPRSAFTFGLWRAGDQELGALLYSFFCCLEGALFSLYTLIAYIPVGVVVVVDVDVVGHLSELLQMRKLFLSSPKVARVYTVLIRCSKLKVCPSKKKRLGRGEAKACILLTGR